jgi:hypothetical protein
MAWRRGRAAALALLVAALAVGRIAGAAPTEADKARARSLLNEGYDLMEKADPQGALEKFVEADNLMHLPVTRLSIARAQSASGKLVQARATLQPLLDEKPKPGEPAAFTQARRDAEDLAARLDVSISTLVVTIVEPPADIAVKLDDQSLPLNQLGVPLKVDPGPHLVVAMGAGLEKRATIKLREGEGNAVTIDFTPPDTAPPPLAPTPATPSKEGARPPTSSGGSGTRWVAWIGFGVGAVGLTVGGIEGGLALSARDRATQEGCQNGKCPPPAQSDEHSSQLSANISTVAFSIGAAGVVAGIVGLLLPAGDHPSQGLNLTPARPRGPSAHLELGPAYLGVSGEM